MKKHITFFTNQLEGRGTWEMVYQFAKHNEKILGNTSRIITLKNPVYNHRPEILEKVARQFDLKFIESYDQLNNYQNTDLFYAAKYGTKDEVKMNNVKNAVHSVFGDFDPHGDVYAYTSKWNAIKNNWDKWVYPIVDVNEYINQPSWRDKYKIPSKDIIFGRTGGIEAFDIPFVHTVIGEIVKNYNHIKFWFTNTPHFFEHPNIRYFDFLEDRKDLFSFINSCDAMIHARSIGECFGYSIADFSMCNKPIITYRNSKDTVHLNILKKHYAYSNEIELKDILTSFEKTNDNFIFYDEFSPEVLMKEFEKLFIL